MWLTNCNWATPGLKENNYKKNTQLTGKPYSANSYQWLALTLEGCVKWGSTAVCPGSSLYFY